MLPLIRELFSLLSPVQRRQFYILQVLVVLMSFAEIAGVASIGFFMALIGNPELLYQDTFLGELYQQSALTNPYDFIVRAGIASLFVLTLNAFFSIFTLWQLARYARKVGVELGDRLFNYYMHQPWLFHASGSSAVLTKNVVTDTAVITDLIIQPLLAMNAKIVLALFLSVPIVIYSPSIALIGLSIFSSAYALLYRHVKIKLLKNGQTIEQATEQRFTLMSEGFGSIKDTLLLGRQQSFTNRFRSNGDKFANSQISNTTLGQSPRFIMEVIALGSIIMLVLSLVKTYEGDLGAVLPALSLYALAGFKILPAFQQIYHSLTCVRSGIPAFEAIKDDLYASKKNHDSVSDQIIRSNDHLGIKNSIILENVTFTYPSKDTPSLNQLDLEIPSNKVIGIVGATGSGKSTLIDLILGLIEPDEGSLIVDGSPINNANKREWQNTLGFVPQSIFLSNNSIKENIAFGLPLEEIDEERIDTVIKLAHLDGMVSELPDGLNTRVGERGVQLSGGQRQRIGIARALYNDADVLVLDEATSALDGITEKIIMDAIHEFSGNKTIIMIAHRFSTVQKCDIIYMMGHGRIIDQGTYDELLERNATFKKMAVHT